MTNLIFRAFIAITGHVKSTNIIHNGIKHNGINGVVAGLLNTRSPFLQDTKNTSFYIKRPAKELWKSVTSVSNAGRRRGRGKGVPRIKNLNKGQKLGVGKIPIIFPGLNAPIVQGGYIMNQRMIPPQEQEEMHGTSEELPIKKRFKLPALKRGWTGGNPAGRKIGPPDAIDYDTFHGFESWILYSKGVSVMTSNMGRTKMSRCMVVTGNRNGLAGFAMAARPEIKSSVHTAKNKAAQRLIYIERYNNHTVLHDFYTQFGHTKIFVKQKHKGYGLKCHRAIRTCCEAIGITDLHAKIEGSTNVKNVVKAFFIGLLQQKTYDTIANEKNLHLVEMRKENNYFPTVLASPDTIREPSEIPSDEVLDFKQYVMGGRIPLSKKPQQPFYTKLPSWLIHLRKHERQRGQDEVILRLRAEYGDICSFLAQKYPEAVASKWRKNDKKNDEEDAEIE